jgi:hypothetical protein
MVLIVAGMRCAACCCSCHVEVLAVGNLTSDNAVEVCRAVQQQLGSGCCLPASQRPRDCCVVLPQEEVLHVQVGVLGARQPKAHHRAPPVQQPPLLRVLLHQCSLHWQQSMQPC